MYNVNINQLFPLLGDLRTREVKPFIEKVLKGKTIHHITGPRPSPGIDQSISRWMHIGKELGVTVTWERIWADKAFEEACDVLERESLNQSFQWSDILKEAYQKGIEYGIKQLRKELWNVDVVMLHETIALPVMAERNDAQWIYASHDFLGWAPKNIYESHIEYLKKIDAIVYPSVGFVMPHLPVGHIWHPCVDAYSPRNVELEEDEINLLYKDLRLPMDYPYIAYVDRYDRLDHAEDLLKYYVNHKVSDQLALVIAGESAETNEMAQLRMQGLEKMAEKHPQVYIRSLPKNEKLINAVRRKSAVQLYWPREGRTDTQLVEALWAGRPVVAHNQLGVRDIARAGVTALISSGPEALLDDALRVYQDKTLAKGLVERARMYTWDYALIDQEIINMACLFLFKDNEPQVLDWTHDGIPARDELGRVEFASS